MGNYKGSLEMFELYKQMSDSIKNQETQKSSVKKQMEYADRKKIPFVIVIGSEEMSNGILTFKDMKTGTQHKRTLTEIISTF